MATHLSSSSWTTTNRQKKGIKNRQFLSPMCMYCTVWYGTAGTIPYSYSLHRPTVRPQVLDGSWYQGKVMIKKHESSSIREDTAPITVHPHRTPPRYNPFPYCYIILIS